VGGGTGRQGNRAKDFASAGAYYRHRERSEATQIERGGGWVASLRSRYASPHRVFSTAPFRIVFTRLPWTGRRFIDRG